MNCGWVIGPNGAGKTTLLDVLCGRARPDVGHAYFKDQDLTKLSEDEIVDLGVGRKFQAPTVFTSLTVADNLMLAVKANRGVFASLFYRLKAAERRRIEEGGRAHGAGGCARRGSRYSVARSEAVVGDRYGHLAGSHALSGG